MKEEQQMTTSTQPQTVLGGGHRGGNILFHTGDFPPTQGTFAHLRQTLAQWFFAAKYLRRFEALKLSNEPTEEDLSSHRMLCSVLITFGEFATNLARERGAELDLESIEMTIGSIEAETRLLRDNFKMFHDDTISAEEAERVLMEAFHEA